MSEQMQREPHAQEGTALGATLAQKIREVGDNVSREIAHARVELNDRAAMGEKGARLLGGAGLAGAIAVAATASLPIIALRRVMPGWAIALSLAGGGGAAAVLLARRGRDELERAAPTDAAEVKDAARDALRNMAP